MAYEAMNKRTAPGYGWWIEQGATTSWEQWSGKGSRNHPMFGGGIVWFYRKLAGMNTDPDQPGYQNIIFRPQPAADISYANYSNLTPYGDCSINWRKENGKIFIEIKVPVGSTATVFVPSNDNKTILESGKKIKKKSGIELVRYERGYAVYKTGSGLYSFESNL
jgi:alpha-L-rhamnosidase